VRQCQRAGVRRVDHTVHVYANGRAISPACDGLYAWDGLGDVASVIG